MDSHIFQGDGDKCRKSFDKRCEDAAKGLSAGAQKKKAPRTPGRGRASCHAVVVKHLLVCGFLPEQWPKSFMFDYSMFVAECFNPSEGMICRSSGHIFSGVENTWFVISNYYISSMKHVFFAI